MKLDVGPVASMNARSWIEWARGVVGDLRHEPPSTGAPPERVLEAFDAYLAEWEGVARAGETFRWSGDADPQAVEYLLHGFHTLAVKVAGETRRGTRESGPLQGWRFYRALVRQLLDGLAHEAPTRAAAEHFRSSWPGLPVARVTSPVAAMPRYRPMRPPTGRRHLHGGHPGRRGPGHHLGRTAWETSEFVPGLLLPPRRCVVLPGRGELVVREVPGPVGAPTVVLLHGLGLTADLNWFPAYLPLGRHFRVLAFDQRGHGRGISSSVFRVEDCADDVAGLIAVLGLRDVVAVGYSMGGVIAQELWRRHPSALAGVVFCATAAGFSSPLSFLGPINPAAWASWWLASWWPASWCLASWWLPSPVPIDILRSALTGQIDLPLRRWANHAHTDVASIVSAAVDISRFRSYSWIGGLDVPAAVVVPDADRLVPVRDQLRLAQTIPGAEVFMTHGGHGAALNHPESFVPALLDACRSVTGRLPRRAPSDE